MSGKLSVGVVGCGAISKIYLTNLTGRFSDRVSVKAVADVVRESAESRAKEFKIEQVGAPEDLLADSSIQLLLNLTPAPNHYEVSKAILKAGKHLYTEKPLALSMPQARELTELAKSRNLRLAVAPDTVLGAGVQTVRKLIDDGAIGPPMAAMGFVSLNSMNERYFKIFRGPLLDLGPYHVGAFVHLLGPARSVSAIVQPQRVDPKNPIPSEILTHDNPGNSAASIEFVGGTLATLIASTEVGAYLPFLRIYGPLGHITAPDPNNFGGAVLLQKGYDKPVEVPLTHDFADNSRGIGVWDIAGALQESRPHRLSPDQALHMTELMLSVIDSHKQAKRIDLTTTCERGEPMPVKD